MYVCMYALDMYIAYVECGMRMARKNEEREDGWMDGKLPADGRESL